MNCKRHLLFLALFSVAFLSACDDPSNVGEDLVGGITGEPETLIVPADTLTADSFRDATGETQRYLAGQVDDPLLGMIAATGYLDLAIANEISTAFREGTVTSAELRLVLDGYVYGDTTSTVTLRLHDLPEEYDFTNTPADTTLTAGAVITEFSFSPTDSLVAVPLPDSWIAANDTTLRSTRFNTSFHGFQLEPVSGNTVVGFRAAGTQLRVVSGGQTVDFGTANTPEVFYTTSRTGTLNLPEDVTLVQDGVGAAARLDLDFDADTLDGSAVNRVMLAAYVDTASFQASPMHFVRPTLHTLALYGVTDDSLQIFVADLPLVSGVFVTTNPTLVSLVQQSIDGNELFEYFRLAPPRFIANDPLRTSTINPALLYNTTAAAEATPRAVLTVTPIE